LEVGRVERSVAEIELVVPSTPEEALAAIRTGPDGEVAVLAGGTDLLADLDEERVHARRLVSLKRLPWRTLDWNGSTLTIGSTLPLRALEMDPSVRARIPGLYEAVHAVGSVQLRHRATLGGNLGRAAPASDLIPILLVLDAEVELLGPGGARWLPVDRFVRASRATAIAPGELIRSVRVPEARPSAFLWQRVRLANDISQLAVAVARSAAARAWRVAVGGIPPRAFLLDEAATALRSDRPSPDELRRASESAARAVPIVADRRASEEYRRHLIGTLLVRAVRSTLVAPGERA
jgi:xanthine dehydrogenase small subunit